MTIAILQLNRGELGHLKLVLQLLLKDIARLAFTFDGATRYPDEGSSASHRSKDDCGFLRRREVVIQAHLFHNLEGHARNHQLFYRLVGIALRDASRSIVQRVEFIYHLSVDKHDARLCRECGSFLQGRDERPEGRLTPRSRGTLVGGRNEVDHTVHVTVTGSGIRINLHTKQRGHTEFLLELHRRPAGQVRFKRIARKTSGLRDVGRNV